MNTTSIPVGLIESLAKSVRPAKNVVATIRIRVVLASVAEHTEETAEIIERAEIPKLIGYLSSSDKRKVILDVLCDREENVVGDIEISMRSQVAQSG